MWGLGPRTAVHRSPGPQQRGRAAGKALRGAWEKHGCTNAFLSNLQRRFLSNGSRAVNYRWAVWPAGEVGTSQPGRRLAT